MSVQRSDAVARANIPEFDSAIATATRQDITLRTKGNRVNFIPMSGATSQALSLANIPQLYRAVSTTTG
jgi:hypothetical protein